jgi:5-hydroxyisourate hydrolase-like protein (transthyretin family)
VQVEDPSSLTGHVTNAGGGTPISDVTVHAFDASGAFVDAAETDDSGRYAFGTLPGGTYYVRTFNSLDYLDELYDDVPCSPTCVVTSGTPIVVTTGTTQTANFTLRLGSTIRGRVTDAATGAPIANLDVWVADAGGVGIGSARTDSNGVYVSPPLPDGHYFLRTFNNQGYRDEVFDDIACLVDCRVTNGLPLPLVTGLATTGIDFALERGGSIAGHVTDETTGSALTSVSVEILDRDGRYISTSWIQPDGSYRSTGLPSGSYRARTRNSNGYVDEIHDNVTCIGGQCAPGAGSLISVVDPSTTGGIDFALRRGGQIRGSVRAAVSGDRIDNVSVGIFDSSGSLVDSAWAGNVTYATTGLPAGMYFARTANSSGFKDRLYSAQACVAGRCTATAGTPIVVLEGGITSGIDFELEPGAQIEGLVLDAITQSPISNTTVQIFDSVGTYLTSGWSDTGGRFTTTGLDAGTYYARTFNDRGYVDKLHENIPCPLGTCAVLSGRPITLAEGAHELGVNFSLDRGGRIAGRVTDAVTGDPIANVWVQIYTADGSFAGSGPADAGGRYEVKNGLPPATY